MASQVLHRQASPERPRRVVPAGWLLLQLVCNGSCNNDGLPSPGGGSDGRFADLGKDHASRGSPCQTDSDCTSGLCAHQTCSAALSFAPERLFSIETMFGMALADMNGDGREDLALNIVDSQFHGLELRMSTADGLGEPLRYTVPARATGISSGDFDLDGKSDLVLLSTSIDVFLGDGKGGILGPIETWTSGSSTLLLGDFNGDRKLDVFASTAPADCVNGSTDVWLARGDGTFPRHNRVYPNACTRAAALGDLDRDGILDVGMIWVGSFGSTSLKILLGTADGNFLPVASPPFGEEAAAWQSFGMQFAHIDGDALMDVVVSRYAGVDVYRSDGSSGFAQLASLAQTHSPGGLLVTDLNLDGTADIVVATGGQVAVYPNRGDGTFAPPLAWSWPLPAWIALAAGDIDGDGRPDLVGGEKFGHGLALLMNTSQ
jgi:VCBS repeat protein